MIESPLHFIINEVRNKYSGKSISNTDLRKIEYNYKICSILNFRDNNIASLRITSFGIKGVNFEEIQLDLNFLDSQDSLGNKLFCIYRMLYKMAYDIDLNESRESTLEIDELVKIDFTDIQSKIEKIEASIEILEEKISKANNTSLFDFT